MKESPNPWNVRNLSALAQWNRAGEESERESEPVECSKPRRSSLVESGEESEGESEPVECSKPWRSSPVRMFETSAL